MTATLPQTSTAGTIPNLLMVGWQGPPFNGRVHVVSSLMKPPFTNRFSFTGYDTRMRNRHGGSRPDATFLRSAVRQVTDLKATIADCSPTAAVFFTGPGPTFWRDLLLLRSLHRSGIPVYIRLFGGVLTEQFFHMPAPLRKLAINLFGRAKAILVETNAMVADLKRLCPGVPAYRVANFIDVDALPPPKDAERTSGDRFRVIYMGNMTPTKGVETILRSVDTVVDHFRMHRQVEFHFIGGEIEPGYLDAFRQRCAALRHGNHVTVHGKMARADAHAIAATGDVFAFPTCWPGEGQPAALIEAMGMGLVPIATRWRGVSEIVRQGENGILLDSPDDAEALGAAIETLIASPEECQRLSTAARAHIAAEYDAEPALDRFSRIFHQTMETIS